MDRVRGKVAVITGGSSGIGLAAAKKLAQEGAQVTIMARSQDRLNTAASAIGYSAVGVQGDAADLSDLDRLFGSVRDRHGRIDILFLSAGRGHEARYQAPLGEISEEQFEEIFALNVRGTLFAAQKALPLLAQGASVILNGSVIGVKGIPGSTVHSASKAVERSFVRTWAAEFGSRRIRFNILSPGPTATPAMSLVPVPVRKHMEALIPRGVLGQELEIANAVLFLASDESSFINGAELFVDGGLGQI